MILRSAKPKVNRNFIFIKYFVHFVKRKPTMKSVKIQTLTEML